MCVKYDNLTLEQNHQHVLVIRLNPIPPGKLQVVAISVGSCGHRCGDWFDLLFHTIFFVCFFTCPHLPLLLLFQAHAMCDSYYLSHQYIGFISYLFFGSFGSFHGVCFAMIFLGTGILMKIVDCFSRYKVLLVLLVYYQVLALDSDTVLAYCYSSIPAGVHIHLMVVFYNLRVTSFQSTPLSSGDQCPVHQVYSRWTTSMLALPFKLFTFQFCLYVCPNKVPLVSFTQSRVCKLFFFFNLCVRSSLSFCL